MPSVIVLQPNGLYAIWSTVVDAFTHMDCTESEICSVMLNRNQEILRNDLHRRFKDLKNGYAETCFGDKMTFETCLESIREEDDKSFCQKVMSKWPENRK